MTSDQLQRTQAVRPSAARAAACNRREEGAKGLPGSAREPGAATRLRVWRSANKSCSRAAMLAKVQQRTGSRRVRMALLTARGRGDCPPPSRLDRKDAYRAWFNPGIRMQTEPLC
jgi:hypothetical protein